MVRWDAARFKRGGSEPGPAPTRWRTLDSMAQNAAMLRWAWVLAVVGPLAAVTSGVHAQARFGVVTQRDTEPPCATFAGPRLPSGSPVLIEDTESHRTIAGTVADVTTPCHEQALVEGTSYLLNVPSTARGILLAPAMVPGSHRPTTTLRSCTSSEGVHLTAWQGRRRVWHTYVYLGYDVEPTCESAETRD